MKDVLHTVITRSIVAILLITGVVKLFSVVAPAASEADDWFGLPKYIVYMLGAIVEIGIAAFFRRTYTFAVLSWGFFASALLLRLLMGPMQGCSCLGQLPSVLPVWATHYLNLTLLFVAFYGLAASTVLVFLVMQTARANDVKNYR